MELPVESRDTYIHTACGDDTELRTEVERMVETEEYSTYLIGAGEGWHPNRIGRYRILGVLGKGGMGTVYEAEQDHPRRSVALKVIQPGFAGPGLLRRFDVEAEALGRLHHPGIAQIYEAGTADSGFGPQPYFAMELIRGEPLLEYAEKHQLNTRQRLELMAKISDAVQHAHQRGIIHRDLKPGNILVEEGGQPKVLDFGVAREAHSDAQATRQTDVGQIVGTLAYMSPEQVLGDPLELDTRSDVYALGVILFELLAGCLPYHVSGQLHEAVRAIREEDPVRLSSINRIYRGDIDTIVAKALEKEKGQRYSSAAGMAGDIRRYLDDEPIVARPPSTAYQLRKFARRHKALVVGFAAVLAVLIAGIIVSTWEARRATAEAATARAVNDFLQNDLLAQASPNVQSRPDTKPDPELKVRTALDRAGARLTGKFDKQPLVEASIRQTIGNTYRDLGLYPEAHRNLQRAIDLRRRVLGEQHPDTLTAMYKLGQLYLYEGKYAQAEPLLARVLELRRRVLGAKHPDTLSTLCSLGLAYLAQGKYAQAEPLLTKAVEMQRRVLGPEHIDTLESMNALGALYVYEGKYAQAEPLFTKVLEVRRRVLGESHTDTLNSTDSLAFLYDSEGKYAQAEPLYAKNLESYRSVMGTEHPMTLGAMTALGTLYVQEGKYQQAEPLLTQALDGARRVLGEEHPFTLESMRWLAQLYQEQGKYPKAETLFTKILEVRRRVLGAEDPDTLWSMDKLAFIYVKEAGYLQAEQLARASLNGYVKVAPNDWNRYKCEGLLGAGLAGQKRYAEAEPLLLSGYEGMIQRESTIPAWSRFNLRETAEWIVQLYGAWGKPAKAAEWSAKLQPSKASARPQ
ncbi:MAG: serine/threonine protein kinase [Acidobacteriaceae bacterium]|nr:serine/threonine protein kinase [Acidobacteriaceae bacterium]MBV9502327.1 serine/threonine protein kinase [Acidobacteriaceae bacterium]